MNEVQLSTEQNKTEDITEIKKVIASYDAILDVLKSFEWKIFTWSNSRVERLVDPNTAYVIQFIHDAVNDTNKKKIEHMIAEDPESFERVATVSWRNMK